MSEKNSSNISSSDYFTDYLSGLPNFYGFQNFGEQLLNSHTLVQFCAVSFDIRGFGLINLRFGTSEGDAVLRRYSDILREFIQEDECVGRLGEDNFIALVRKEHVQDFLGKIARVSVAAYFENQEMKIELASVAGVLELDRFPGDIRQIISQCSVAMNEAKKTKQKSYLFFSDELNRQSSRRHHIHAVFHTAMENGEFVPYYQPKVNTKTGLLSGAEALVRWISDGQMISPGEFIPVLESDNSICELDFYMLESVCRDIRNWIETGIEPVRISVNFSRKHLHNLYFSQQIADIIARYQVDYKYIEIEITETASVEENDMLNLFMIKMQQYGIATAIDDFGTGVSSFNVLRNYPVDVLKIDKSFIDNVIITKNDSVVITSIVKMAKELGMDVITEGVENVNQLDFLHSIGCHLIQGFLFDRPMPVEEFTERLKNKQYDMTKFKK